MLSVFQTGRSRGMRENAIFYPFFRYKEAPAAIEWLGKAFGFKELMKVPNDDGTIAHAELHLGPVIIMVGSGDDLSDDPAPTDVHAIKQGLYVAIDDVDAHCNRAKAAGARVLRGPEDTEYGSREYSAIDPGGYYWSFGTYRPEVPS
jgi:uncharacterized glyoxalase superfamily protein PhnB